MRALAPFGPPVDPEAGVLLAGGGTDEVLQHRQRARQAEVLVHETETDVVEAAGRHRERDRLAPDLERPTGLGLVHAGEHLDQRRLATAVLAEQGVDLSVCHGEAHAVECSGGAELLGYVREFERGLHR